MTNNHTFSENKLLSTCKLNYIVLRYLIQDFFFSKKIDNKHKMDKTYYTLLNKLNVGT